MKMVMAIIKPFKLDDVRDALTKIGVEGLTATDVKGFGRQRGQAESKDQNAYAPHFLPKLKIEVAVPKKLLKKTMKAIQDSANTGRIGDGKIFVYDLENVVRIRTGENGEDAI